MSTDGGDDPVSDVPAPSGDSSGPSAARRVYNRPRRYPVQAPAAQDTDAPAAATPTPEVTRQNPSLAEAADAWRRQDADGGGPGSGGAAGVGAGAGSVPPGVLGAPPAGAPAPYPATYPHDPGPSGYPSAGPHEAGGPPGRSRTPSTRTLLLIGAAVVVVALVVGLIVGLSGSDDSSKPKGAAPPAATTSTTATSAAPTTAPGGAPASSSTVPTAPSSAGGAPPAATEVCATLGSTTPFANFVAQPRPGERMPTTYVEPQSGTKVAMCVGFFRPGGGAGRGRIAYLAEYERLAATQYALTLKTLGWVLVPTLPRATYRNNLGTTVTLVQQGTSLVTVVGTGR